jgi:hypothetical protein
VGRHRGLTTQDSSGRRRLAVLRRWLHGRVDWWPAEVGRWLRRLAEILPAVHAVPLSRGPAPVLPQVLIHRDFHPGNVLWRRGLVCGIVDWQAICSGPAAADVARCRVNLLTLGTSAAEQFTACWQHVSGAAYHPWADVVTIIGFLDDLREDWGSEQFLVEDMLGRAVAELGRSGRLPRTSLTRTVTVMRKARRPWARWQPLRAAPRIAGGARMQPNPVRPGAALASPPSARARRSTCRSSSGCPGSGPAGPLLQPA